MRERRGGYDIIQAEMTCPYVLRNRWKCWDQKMHRLHSEYQHTEWKKSS